MVTNGQGTSKFKFFRSEVVFAGKDFRRSFKRTRAPIRRKSKVAAKKIIFVRAPISRIKTKKAVAKRNVAPLRRTNGGLDFIRNA